MNKLMNELKKDYTVIKYNYGDVLVIILNKNTKSYLGSFKIDDEKKLVYNTEFKNLSVYELSRLSKLLEDYSNEIL